MQFIHAYFGLYGNFYKYTYACMQSAVRQVHQTLLTQADNGYSGWNFDMK